MLTKAKKRVRFSPDVIFEYTGVNGAAAVSMQERRETLKLSENDFIFTEDNSTNLMSIYEDFYDSYQFISEYGDVSSNIINVRSYMDLMEDKETEIEIDMKSISIDTTSTSCDDFDISTPIISHPSRTRVYYSPDATTELSLKKKFKTDLFFKSRNFWCDPTGRTINWSVFIHIIIIVIS